MKVAARILPILSVVLFFAGFANAQCGQTYGCVTSYTLAPGEIIGDNAHTSIATITAAGPGTNSWTVLLTRVARPFALFAKAG